MTAGEAAVWASASDLFGTMFRGFVVLATSGLFIAMCLALMVRWVRP